MALFAVHKIPQSIPLFQSIFQLSN